MAVNIAYLISLYPKDEPNKSTSKIVVKVMFAQISSHTLVKLAAC